MTFAQELAHAIAVEPVKDSRLSRHPSPRDRRDAAGDEIRVFERDSEDGIQAILKLNVEKGVYPSEVWQDIVAVRHDHPSQAKLRTAWLAMNDEQKFRYHVKEKCPKAEDAAIWVGYRNGTPAHARLLDRHKPPSEVWIQWVVGTNALGPSGHTLIIALWDIGVRRVCWKFLPNHPLVRGHWQKFPDIIIEPVEAWERHHPGHYMKGRIDLRHRPDQPYEQWRRG